MDSYVLIKKALDRVHSHSFRKGAVSDLLGS